MNTEITVSDIPIDQAGEILSQSVTAGVNQIESVTYFSSQYDENYQEALKGAVAMARSKAEAMAEASAFFCGRYSGIRLQSAGPIFLLQCHSSQDGSGRNGCSFRHGGNARRGQRRGPGYSDLWAGVRITKETRGLLSKKRIRPFKADGRSLFCSAGRLYTDSIYFSASLSFGSVTFKKTATRVAITTGDLPKMVVTQSGKEAKEAEDCETPIPRAAARPTMEVLR